MLEKEGDYPYKYLQYFRENNINRIKKLDILRNKNDNYLSWNNAETSTIYIQTLNSYNLSTFKPIYDLKNSSSFMGLSTRGNANVQLNNEEDNKDEFTRNARELLYLRFLGRNILNKTANHIERSKRYLNDDIINLAKLNSSMKFGKFAYSNQWRRNIRGLDTYAESLLYVNKIYNAAYGLERRRVPAHMPHLIDKWVVSNMQQKFESEFKKTSSHKVRDPEDMQFAFSYFYFLASEKRKVSTDEIFDMFDTDKSQ